jgi:hypothetical protein
MVSCGGEPEFGHGLATDVVTGQPSSRPPGEAEWNIMGEGRPKRCVAHGHSLMTHRAFGLHATIAYRPVS